MNHSLLLLALSILLLPDYGLAKEEIFGQSFWFVPNRRQIQACDAALRPVLQNVSGNAFLVKDGGNYRLTIRDGEDSGPEYDGFFRRMGAITLAAKDVTLLKPSSDEFPADGWIETPNPSNLPYGSYLRFTAFSVRPGWLRLKRRLCKVSMTLRFDADPNSLRDEPLSGSFQISCPHLRKRTCNLGLDGTVYYGYL